MIDCLAVFFVLRQRLGHTAVAGDSVCLGSRRLLGQRFTVGSIRAGQVAQLDQGIGAQCNEPRIGQKLFLRKSLKSSFDELSGSLQPLAVIGREQANCRGPVLDLHSMMNRLLPIADRFIARSELGMEPLNRFAAFDRL